MSDVLYNPPDKLLEKRAGYLAALASLFFFIAAMAASCKDCR